MINAYNSGTAVTYPDIVINGPAVNPYIVNDSWVSDSGLARLGLAGTLDVGDVVTISMLYRTVRLNGSNRRTWVVPPHTWWGLALGDNFIRFGADTLSGATAILTYSDALE